MASPDAEVRGGAMKFIVSAIMNWSCEVTDHRLGCYNRPRWINRLWAWALDV